MYAVGISLLLVLFIGALLLASMIHQWITKPLAVPLLERKTGQPTSAGDRLFITGVLFVAFLALPYAPPMAYSVYLCATTEENPRSADASEEFASLDPAAIARLYDISHYGADMGMGVFLAHEVAYNTSTGSEVARATSASYLWGLPLLPDPTIRCSNYSSNIATVMKVINAREQARR